MGETINLCPDQTNPKATALQRDVHQQLSNALERRLDLSVDKVDDVLQQNVGGELFGARRAVGQAELEAGEGAACRRRPLLFQLLLRRLGRPLALLLADLGRLVAGRPIGPVDSIQNSVPSAQTGGGGLLSRTERQGFPLRLFFFYTI